MVSPAFSTGPIDAVMVLMRTGDKDSGRSQHHVHCKRARAALWLFIFILVLVHLDSMGHRAFWVCQSSLFDASRRAKAFET